MRKLILILAILLGTVAVKAQSLKMYTMGSKTKAPDNSVAVTVAGVKGYILAGNSSITGEINSIYFSAYVNEYAIKRFISDIKKHYKLEVISQDPVYGGGFSSEKDNIDYAVSIDRNTDKLKVKFSICNFASIEASMEFEKYQAEAKRQKDF